MKNSKQGVSELAQLMSKALPIRKNSPILTPDSAELARQLAYQKEWSTIWTLRENLLTAMMQGGYAPEDTADAVVAVNLAEDMAKELVRRRVAEAFAIAEVSAQKHDDSFLYLARVLGVDVPAGELEPTQAAVTE